jgi:hypothetical protein
VTRANPDTHHWLVRHYSHNRAHKRRVHNFAACTVHWYAPSAVSVLACIWPNAAEYRSQCSGMSMTIPSLFSRRSRHSLRTLTTLASRTQPPQDVFLHAVYSALLSCFREQASTVGQPGEERLRGRKVCRALTDLPKGPTLRTHRVEVAHPAS